MLQTVQILAVIAYHIWKKDKSSYVLLDALELILLICLGGLTQYYFYIFAAVFGACICIYMLASKRFKLFVGYAASLWAGVIMALVIFPATIKYHLSGYRGNYATDSIGKFTFEKFRLYDEMINKELFAGIAKPVLFVLLACAVCKVITWATNLTVTQKEHYCEVRFTLKKLAFEEKQICLRLFVNDGSKDKTLDILRSFAQKDSRVRYISFSRNFGKESAMYAGFQTCTGDYAAVMDADMQDPPSLLPEMYKALQTGEYDSVATRRVDRKGEPPIRSFFARCFYKIINKMSDADIVDGARDFRLMKRKMVDAIVSMGEYNRFSKGIFGWVGFRTKWLPYENVERVAGTTKWNFWKLFKYSIEGIVGFSTAPLLLAVCIGLAFCALAFIGIVFVIVRALAFGDPTSGWPSLVCIILLCSGVQLMCTGIAGEYLAKTYLEVKHRPIYIVAETEEDLSKKELTQCN